MKFYLIVQGETVVVTALVEWEDGPMGDYQEVIHPGESFSGIPYEQLRSLAEQCGKITIRERNS